MNIIQENIKIGDISYSFATQKAHQRTILIRIRSQGKIVDTTKKIIQLPNLLYVSTLYKFHFIDLINLQTHCNLHFLNRIATNCMPIIKNNNLNQSISLFWNSYFDFRTAYLGFTQYNTAIYDFLSKQPELCHVFQKLKNQSEKGWK